MPMKIVNPPYTQDGTDPSNVFYALDDFDTPMGMGYVLPQYQPDIYPDSPLNFFFQIKVDGQQDDARYMLLGAIMAKAGEYVRQSDATGARLYTQLESNDHAEQAFYTQNGFDLNDEDCWMGLEIPYGDGQIPMSMMAQPIPLQTYEEQYKLLERLWMNGIQYVNEDYLNRLQHMPHFLTLGLYRQTSLIGEVIMAGQGQDCEVVAIYMRGDQRGQGFAKALLHRAMAFMASEGVTRITARVMTRSVPQARLAAAFNGRPFKVETVFPGINLT